MLILTLFAFIGGVITILSPCILPILPIILSTSVGGGKSRPYGIVAGFIASFTFFTLFLSTIVKLTGIPASSLRYISVFVIAGFGASLLIPKVQLLIEQMFVKFSRFVPQNKNSGGGFGSGLLVGASLGLLWTPCVGPILASVISLALIGDVNGAALIITFAYSLGTAIPMFAIIVGGQNLLNRVPGLVRNTGKIQKAFGVVMIATALAIFFNFDRQFQTYILQKFPQYGTGLTSLEDNQLVQSALNSFGSDKKEINDMKGKPMNELTEPKLNYPQAPELIPTGEWFGSAPLTIASQRGKVVLIDFWTYTCINCIRTLPYLRDWYDKYADDGLVIIGVHTPEFEFEKDAKNLAKAIEDFGLKYPIVQDNEYKTWRAYNNRFWPAKYLIDKDGYIRYTHFGEGKYDETEEMIQILLNETGKQVSENINTDTYQIYSRTPETYLGYARINSFASPESILQDKFKIYSYPNKLTQNTFALSGNWRITPEYSESDSGAKLQMSFESKEVFLVMRSDNPTEVKVYLDGKLVDQNNTGEDVENGTVTVSTNRLYKLINLEKASKHILELEFLNSGIQAFAFTFG